MADDIRSVRTLLLLSCGLLCVSSGCLGAAWKSGGVLRRVRIDCNSYRQAAVTCTSYDHLPSRTKDVRHFRWLHGADPVLPYPGEEKLKPPKRASWVTRCRASASAAAAGNSTGRAGRPGDGSRGPFAAAADCDAG